MVIWVQCGKSPQQNRLKFSQNAYLTKTKGFSKCGVDLVSRPNTFLKGRGVTGDRCHLTELFTVLIFWIYFGIGATIHTHLEFQCLPYKGFSLNLPLV